MDAEEFKKFRESLTPELKFSIRRIYTNGLWRKLYL